jgi:hypothetical protein
MNGGDVRPRRGGKPSLPVPHAGEKIDHMLERIGRPTKWLTEVVSSPEGSRPSQQSVSNWKKHNVVPLEYVTSLCYALGIDRALLSLTDLPQFRAAAASALAPGSGRFWKTLIEHAAERPDGLELRLDEAVFQQRVGNLSFRRQPARAPKLQEIPLDAGLRFSIPAATLAPLTNGKAASSLRIVLCCEDRQGWKTFCPHRHDGGFQLADGHWLLPGAPDRFLYLEKTLGLYRAVAIAFAERPPPPVYDALEADRTVWGTDALATWLFETGQPFRAFQRQFLVVAARGRR